MITTRPKESELTIMLEWPPLMVDAYPEQAWNGVVESIDSISGAEFSILSEQSSFRNWAKVEQCIPLRVEIIYERKDFPLRDDMSAEIPVDTRHHRFLPGLF